LLRSSMSTALLLYLFKEVALSGREVRLS